VKGGVWEALGLGDWEGGNRPRVSAAPLQSFWQEEKDAVSGEAPEVGRREPVPKAGGRGLPCRAEVPTAEQLPARTWGNQFTRSLRKALPIVL